VKNNITESPRHWGVERVYGMHPNRNGHEHRVK
jgi:hypothetical protein